jgi:RNA polymerase sigma-70 factor, ECF subfamily
VSPHARFEELYRAHAGRVRAYALRRTTAGAADDVVSEVFLIAWRRLDRVPDRPLPWLLGVARRVLANRRRSDDRVGALHARLAAAHRDHDPDALPGDERVLAALAGCSEADRELLMLVAWEELAAPEIAEVLGIRRGTVAVRLHRARQRFAESLATADARVPRPDPDLEVRR